MEEDNKMLQNKIRTLLHPAPHIYTLSEADRITTEDDVLRLPRVIYYQDEETRKVITYKLRRVAFGYEVDAANKCIRRLLTVNN